MSLAKPSTLYRTRSAALSLLAALSCRGEIMAASPTPEASPPGASQSAGFFEGIDRRSNLFGDLGGIRPLLSRYGMTLQLQETSEVLGNVTGGSRTGFAYDGLTTATLQMDTQRAFGVWGGLLNVSGLNYHGRNLSALNLQTLQTASGIQANQATRLWELWYQQKLDREGRFDLRIGQQSLDQEFMVSQSALLFVNTMFGWPMLPSADLPGGGPAYPLSALGGRVKAQVSDGWTVLLGAFNGNPAQSRDGDSQTLNRSGTIFPLNGGTLVIGEVQYSYPGPGTTLYADQPEPLPRTYKLGFWYHTSRFDDLRYDTSGLSLADPSSTGAPKSRRGNFSIYAVADQVIWQDERDSERTVNVFFRAMGTPLADRNLIDFSLNAGLTLKEPFLHRDNDTVGVGIGYAHVSKRAAGLDSDTANFTGAFTPARGGETFIEATYQYQAAPWWQIQPVVQYTFNPGAGVANPNSPNQRIKNETVIGLRTNIQF